MGKWKSDVCALHVCPLVITTGNWHDLLAQNFSHMCQEEWHHLPPEGFCLCGIDFGVKKIKLGSFWTHFMYITSSKVNVKQRDIDDCVKRIFENQPKIFFFIFWKYLLILFFYWIGLKGLTGRIRLTLLMILLNIYKLTNSRKIYRQRVNSRKIILQEARTKLFTCNQEHYIDFHD